MKVKILDCTLRDGGYINDFKFGLPTIKAVVRGLSSAKIDIVEVGFLSDNGSNSEVTIFGSTQDIRPIINPKSKGCMYVAMLALGEREIAVEKISERGSADIDGIRVTFHGDEIDRAFEVAHNLRNKGYEVFLQPVGITSYTDQDLLGLVESVNRFRPFAFYIVDTLGTMREPQLLRYFYLLDHNLEPSISVGFHSHNNLQLSFSNAQLLLNLKTHRRIILDSTVLGMGRGAGNLCTELITQHINLYEDGRYVQLSILELVDNHILPLQKKYSWGYSIPYYLAAIHNCHPNYAAYLLNKQTLSMASLEELLEQITDSKRAVFHREHIDSLYRLHQEHFVDDRAAKSVLQNMLTRKHVLLLGPGPRLTIEANEIDRFSAGKDLFTIAVNFRPDSRHVDLVFFGNSRRYLAYKNQSRGDSRREAVAVTSNVDLPDAPEMVFNYAELTGVNTQAFDNSLIMLIRLLISIGIGRLSLAGFDGFGGDSLGKYYSSELETSTERSEQETLNAAIQVELDLLSANCAFEFITQSLYAPGVPR